MKQEVNKAQWDELSNKQKGIFSANIGFDDRFYFGDTDFREIERYPNVGQIIEYLGKDLDAILFSSPISSITVTSIKYGALSGEELIDIFWKIALLKIAE